MTRFAAISAIFLTGAFATLLVNLHTPSEPLIGQYDESHCDERTRQKVVSYYLFKSTLTAVLNSLAQGTTSLKEARNQVYESALQYNPEYLRRLAICERGTTPQERVARNLIGHVCGLELTDPTICVRIFALEIEFAEMQQASTESRSTKS
jgi:hypothetical protein